jgi:shikimate kinase
MTTPAVEQLQLLHQIQNHTLPFLNTLYLGIVLNLPFIPIEWKLGIYNFLTSPSAAFLTNIKLSPVALVILIGFYPLITLAVLCLLGYLLVQLILLLLSGIRYGIGRFQKVAPKIFLELTFPHDTTKSAYATEELYRLLHTLSRQKSFWDRVLQRKNGYSLEIVSTRNEGIRYLVAAGPNVIETIQYNLRSYLPGIHIRVVNDYLGPYLDKKDDNLKCLGLEEFKLSGHFALPLETQTALKEHDPISYLTGNMTKLTSGELVAFQVVTTPLLPPTHKNDLKEMQTLRRRMVKGEPLTPVLQKDFLQKIVSLPVLSAIWLVIKISWTIFWGLFSFVIEMISTVANENSKTPQIMNTTPKVKPQQILNPYEQELSTIIKGKIDQTLFETSIRILVVADTGDEVNLRLNGLMAAFGQLSSSYQSLVTKHGLIAPGLQSGLQSFKNRTLSQQLTNPNPILSASELSDLFHFPYMDTTKTEGLVKSKSRDLPAPLSLKRDTTKLDVVVGKNNYGGEETAVGLTSSQRHEHTYIVGKTGMGKTTIIKQMAYQDILSGKGVAVIDPHGDLVKELLSVIPNSRKKDVIYLDPTDKLWPVGLNILVPGGTFVDEEEKADWITGSVISVFMKITPKANWGQRMEHILRNATMTALTTESPTLMTIQKLLTNKEYRQQVTATLKDPVLKQFWADEFKMFGNMQKADMISPLTNKLGEFITSTLSRHILLQAESTIKFSNIMDQGKVLLVNLSKGNLGEERSGFFGTLIISLIQMAAYQRAQIPENKRKDFFLYIDEFQNFANAHFADIFSEARKFHVFIIPSHQNIAQIEDVKTAKVVLGNSGTIISLKNGPDDEAVILPFMEPEVEKGQIVNLPPYHFFMKVTNEDSEDAFSGETVPLDIKGSDTVRDFVIANTRKRYATSRAVVEKQLNILFGVSEEPEEKTVKKMKYNAGKTGGSRRKNTHKPVRKSLQN